MDRRPKSGGRKRGTPNHRTTELSEFLESIRFSVPEKLGEILPKLSHEKQADVLLKLMEYLYPKRKALDLTTDMPLAEPNIVICLPDNGRGDSDVTSQTRSLPT